jgi:hypothetical protein
MSLPGVATMIWGTSALRAAVSKATFTPIGIKMFRVWVKEVGDFSLKNSSV